ncbi:DUF7674 family protein [Turneriella parva]|uniref:DUF7674 domain-containing protein n=1 Tax=Turneriella parva (strain ATCC BAA-1111 / DSM 21527 / NCTC 11395 / H) TaxID=869212 RepID=I4B9T3_TURPD|nr:hypothetical protein [Turneriella parva]AFM14040.1 hypothetical protein Turpa_3403 [Turneriella parva DSM 21527]
MEETEENPYLDRKDNNIHEAIETFRPLIEDFDEKLSPVKAHEKIDRFGTISVHTFFEVFLLDYCYDLVKRKDMLKLKRLFLHIEYLLQTFPLLENAIAVSFLEDLYGNHHPDRAIYIQLSGEETLKLSKQIMSRFVHEVSTNQEIDEELKKRGRS